MFCLVDLQTCNLVQTMCFQISLGIDLKMLTGEIKNEKIDIEAYVLLSASISDEDQPEM